MSVNGVEILVGQKWVMRDGKYCTVKGRKPGLLYPWIVEWADDRAPAGVLRMRVSDSGACNVDQKDDGDLITLVQDASVEVTPAVFTACYAKPTVRQHNHYFKDVSHLDQVDVYRVLSLFTVTDPCLQHAIKKLLVAGGRGAGKDITKDVQEAIDSLTRWREIRAEDGQVSK